jgi:tol-pal system protein YbgF
MPALPSLPLPRIIAGPRRALRPRALAGGLTLALLMAGALPAPAAAQEQQGLIADMQVRLTQLEQLVQQLTGQLEQAQFRNRELERRLDLLEREIDLGLSGDGGGGTMAAAPPTAASPPAGPAPSPQAGGPRPLAPDNGVLGYLGNDGGAAPATAGGGGASQQAALPAGPPEAQYQHAFSLLRQGSFESAEAAFSAFIQAHPRHTLAGNAQYWLGETHYARGDYDAAARAFAKGFKDYPSGSKTPDNLFKLGMSMSALGKKREACAAFQKLRADYPGVAGTLSRQVADQMARNGC